MKSRVKFFAYVVLMVLLVNLPAHAELPKTYKEFKARYQTEAKTYKGAIKLYFDAVFAYINKETRTEGGKMLRYSLRSELPIDRSTFYATFADRLKDPAWHEVFRSFAEGSSPENNYAMDPDDYELVFTGQVTREVDYLRVFLESSGADSPRAVWVKKFDDGLWFVINNAATYVQVKPGKAEIDRRNRAFDADFDEEEPEEAPKPATTEPEHRQVVFD